MKLITVHSLRGGAGRTTLALRKAREAGPGTVLIETDLTGTSLCDVLPLRAPDLGSLPNEALKLTRVPRSWHSKAESRARMELRHRSALQRTRLHPWGLPFLNDWLLFTPEQDSRAGDAHAEALLWMEDPDLGLRIIPASPLPHDQLATQVFNDEPNTGFVESRLEFLVAALHAAGVSTVVFDTGRGLRGVPGGFDPRLVHQPARVTKIIITEEGLVAKSRTSGLGTDRSQPVTLEAALLRGLLDGPSFGLDLIERIKHKSQGQVALHQGTVYPLLRHLEARGWLQGHAGQPGGGAGGHPRADTARHGGGQEARGTLRPATGGDPRSPPGARPSRRGPGDPAHRYQTEE